MKTCVSSVLDSSFKISGDKNIIYSIQVVAV